MIVKKLIGKIHLWLGLSSGLVVFLVSLSGAIMVFEHEIRWLIGTSAMDSTVPAQVATPAPPSLVFEKALAAVGEGGSYIYYYTGKTKSHVLINWFYHAGDSIENIKAGYRELHQNPYTGDVLYNELWEGGFWGWMVKFHTSLLLPPNIGHQVVGWSTIIFVILMMTGLALWFPKSKKGYKQRFTIKWKAKIKRVNYDLHNVLGFYMLSVTMVIALTGLVWSFEWFRNGVYALATGGKEMPAHNAIKSQYNPTVSQSSVELMHLIDEVTNQTLTKYPEFYRYTVGYPLDSVGVINVGVMTEKGKNYDRHDEYIFDRYTGALINSELWSNQNAGERIMHLNYPLHLGLIGGLPTKILAFFASLVAASLPLTGFYIWWGRKKKVIRKRPSRKTLNQVENTLVRSKI
ncbi:MAG: PepSY-associated TM helix domain-containing protein [Bacteroidota bacterium]